MSERPSQAEIDEANASHAQEALEQEWRREAEIAWNMWVNHSRAGTLREAVLAKCSFVAAFLAAKQSDHAASAEKNDELHKTQSCLYEARRMWSETITRAQTADKALAEKDRKIAELERDCKEYSRHINELDDARKELTRQNEEKDRKIAELKSDECFNILVDLTKSLDSAFISSWQTTSAWQKELDAAKEYVIKHGVQL